MPIYAITVIRSGCLLTGFTFSHYYHTTRTGFSFKQRQRATRFYHQGSNIIMFKKIILCISGLFCLTPVFCQMITGTWKGKINRQKVEVKIIQKGDSLAGTSYYYESANNYRRYAIRGYFDANTNEAVWWDDQLIEEKTVKFSLSSPGKTALLSSADFNCPGSGRMMLDGKAADKKNRNDIKGEVHLDKTNDPVFEDEWDYVIDNFQAGTNDPYIIDSIAALSQMPMPVIINEPIIIIAPKKEVSQVVKPAPVIEKPVEKSTLPKEEPKAITKTELPKEEQQPVVIKPAELVRPLTIEEKFSTRKKTLVTEIPLTGDSIELRFYDNAEIDGDSISLFLNDKLIFRHIRLTGNAYSIKLSVSELNESNELIMVAENLGTIPPNTSYMIALSGDKRFEARLESTEGSSAMIRLYKGEKKQL